MIFAIKTNLTSTFQFSCIITNLSLFCCDKLKDFMQNNTSLQKSDKSLLFSMWFLYQLCFFLKFLLVFLTVCTFLFYFSASCFVTGMAVLVTTSVLLLLINLDLDLN